ncbi:MAG: ParB/RepB/Spo0J family partition protein [Bacteroidetes bacterium]|nr:ParB/RepB/Spo0J family partition protein [Bacteroidota bacterium]MBV6460448.1 putative chromosome-partitioning protein ParB [Flavobacteriales bacterium]WKZ74196.1 MAG: ParB/RepB/Spo0J family partition protein [Vicingaceae bacterium]MCL4817355.1 ParB/RepB/Spo0J family partition protein [Flavobacteriales bacterium]NOG95891.1 ParB/RepB/Spo0J family partition protein [Bacteroidota bacterium]
MSSSKKPALGRGLSALLENASTDITTKTQVDGELRIVGSISSIPIEQIEANPFQPRTKFDVEAIEELAESIKQLGIIQPVTVRKLGYDKYQLISGERRFRASQLAGLKEIPAYIRIANDQAMLEMALVENVQRENLDAIEIAISMKRLISECNLTQENLSERIGKKRTTVTNFLRLLKLPAEIQMAIRKKAISMGHARALVNIDDEKQQLEICNAIIENGLSVRQAEDMSRGFTPQTRKLTKATKVAKQRGISFSQQKIKNDLSSFFKINVELSANKKGKGKIVIPFASEQELENIVELLKL